MHCDRGRWCGGKEDLEALVVRDVGRVAPRCPTCCGRGREWAVPGRAVLSVAGGGKGLGR